MFKFLKILIKIKKKKKKKLKYNIKKFKYICKKKNNKLCF